MKTSFLLLVFTLVCGFSPVSSRAADGALRLLVLGTNTMVQVDGDKDDDWRIESTADLAAWTVETNLGTLLSGNATNAVWRSIGDATVGGIKFYRAVKTDGLYDPTVFRTLYLTFASANWNTQLTAGRTAETNVLCVLALDNGATNYGVGARYKGNTSFSMAGTKKSINLEIDHTNSAANLMDYSTLNLNNAFGDETLMREPLYFHVMSQYTPCPEGAMCRVFINGSFWGVYSLIEQENGDLLEKCFPSNDGDRWRAPNAATGGGGGGAGFTSSNSAFAYLNTTNLASYRAHYALKNTSATDTNVAWHRLVNAIRALNTTPTNTLRTVLEDAWAVDDWLWFLALENIFTDDDSYWNKGADYGFYYEVESGRIAPVEHDGNEAFTVGDVTLSPLVGYNATGGNARLNNRPLIYRLLANQELRQRYLAHMRTVLEENYNPAVMTPLIQQFHRLSAAAIVADPNKGFTLASYTNDLVALRTHVTNRYNYLRTNAALTPVPPAIVSVADPAVLPTATEVGVVTAVVQAVGTNGLDSVWLYHRGADYGKFAVHPMFDDGAHGDGVAGDGTFGGFTTNYPAGTKVRYYVEARSANPAKAARFSPARAERDTYSYRVALTSASNSVVVINEILADNESGATDPQGEREDWIELRNLGDSDVDLTGCHLSDEPNNPRKWQFPAGTVIPANGYLVVWADEDGTDSPGLHASFKLSKSGEQVFLTDTDANLNAVLDSVEFGAQTTDQSYGRTAADPDVWAPLPPTPGAPNP
jgi:spore coat protein CotH